MHENTCRAESHKYQSLERFVATLRHQVKRIINPLKFNDREKWCSRPNNWFCQQISKKSERKKKNFRPRLRTTTFMVVPFLSYDKSIGNQFPTHQPPTQEKKKKRNTNFNCQIYISFHIFPPPDNFSSSKKAKFFYHFWYQHLL